MVLDHWAVPASCLGEGVGSYSRLPACGGGEGLPRMFQAHTAGMHWSQEEEVVCLSGVFPVSGLGKVRQFRAWLCNQSVCSRLKAHLRHFQAVLSGTDH